MRRWFEVLRAPDNDGPSGGDTHRVDLGAPQEVGVDHEPAEDEPGGTPKKTAEQIELENIRTENERLRQQARDSEEDARYWANRNRRTAADVDEPAPARREPAAAAAIVEMTPEELVEGLNKEGLQALRKAGFISQKELDQKLEELRGEMTGFVKGERADAEFGSRVAMEFPSIAQESARINRAKQQGARYTPTDPLFLRAGELYREAIADDPSLEGSQGMILATARMAKRELEGNTRATDGDGRRTPSGERGRNAEGQFSRREETPARRRDRIERQRPDRGAGGDEEIVGGAEQFTEEQRTVMKNLNVKPEKFVAHRDAGLKQESRRGRR